MAKLPFSRKTAPARGQLRRPEEKAKVVATFLACRDIDRTAVAFKTSATTVRTILRVEIPEELDEVLRNKVHGNRKDRAKA